MALPVAVKDDQYTLGTRVDRVKIWDVDHRKELRTIELGSRADIHPPDGSRMVTGAPASSTDESDIKVWDMATGKELTTLTCRGMLTGLAFDPGGHQLIEVRSASAVSDPVQQIWDGTPRAVERESRR